MLKTLSLRFELEDVRFILDHICSFEHKDVAKVMPYYQHDHSSYELHYVSEGSCILDSNGQKYQLSAGSLVIVPPHLFHRIYEISDPIKKITLSFQMQPPAAQNRNATSMQLFHTLQPRELVCVNLFSQEQNKLGPSIEQLANFVFFAKETPFGYWTKMTSLSTILMVDLFELLLGEQSLSFSYAAPTVSTDFIVDQFFNLNYNGSHTREDLAKMLNVSVRHLDRILQERYGMTFRERLSMTRLKTAIDFLTNTDKSIAEIAELLGYESSSNFSIFIKRETGKTPSEIRKERQA